MKLLVGWGLGGPSFTSCSAGVARLGEPVWGPHELLRDLELRLALPCPEPTASVRVPRWQARMTKVAATDAFYAKSFELDPFGTARTLLGFRDALVDAGWDGLRIPGSGERLDAIASIEQCVEIELPPAVADRVAHVAQSLRRCAPKRPLYDELSLVEPRALWSRRWQQVFSALEHFGTRIAASRAALPGAPPDTDLGRLQQSMRCSTNSTGTGVDAVTGDGSLLLLRGETSADLAEWMAALLAASLSLSAHSDGASVGHFDGRRIGNCERGCAAAA